MFKTRLVNALLVLLIAVVLAATFVLLYGWSRLRGPRIASTPTILQQVQNLSQLVTVKYVMEKVILYEDPSMLPGALGDSHVLMIVHANVLAGINLKELKAEDIQVTERKITIKLPPARAPLVMTSIDESRTQVVERTTGILRKFDKDMEQKARQQAVLDINLAAREAGILNDADTQARAALGNLFHSLGYEDVEFRK